MGSHDTDTTNGTVELSLATGRQVATLRTVATRARIAAARQFAAGAADAFGAGGGASEDAKLAVTEACTNAVMHAYGGGSGPLQVEVRRSDERLVLSVRDRGRGGAPDAAEHDRGRFGLALIEAVASAVHVISEPGSGTEVRVEIDLADVPRRLAEASSFSYAPVVRRIVSLLAAEAGFTLDRLADAVLAAETVALHARAHVVGELLGVGLRDEPGLLELRVGPLEPDGGGALLHDAELPAVGSLVERLAQSVEVERPSSAGEFLVVRLSAHR